MNKQFDKYLAMLESAAPEAKKADFRAARARYRKKAQMEGWFGDSFFGKKPEQKTYGTHANTGAARSEEMKAKADADAKDFRDAEANFKSASKTVLTLAKNEPAKVDAWVDARVKPAVERAINTDDQFLTSEEKTDAFKNEKARLMKEYEKEDKVEQKKLDDELAYSKEQVAYNKGIDDEIATLDKFDDAEDKRAAAAKDFQYDKFPAIMPLNTPKEDVNPAVAQKKHEELVKKQDSDKKARKAEKFWEKEGMSEETSPRISEDEGKKNAAAQKATVKGDDGSEVDPDEAFNKMFGESVSIKDLRSVFESVYGDSKGYSDREIRTICESCYRRTRK